MKVHDYLSRQSRRSIWLHGLLGLLVVGTIDYLTGPELAFSIFYLLPISIIAWFLGRRSGIFAAIIGALIWLEAELLWSIGYSHQLIPFWNASVRALLFIVSSALLSEIAQRKKVEAALRDQTSILQSILNSMGDGVIVADNEEVVILYNPAAERLLGVSLDQRRLTEWLRAQTIFLPDRLTPLASHDHPLVKAIRGESTDGIDILLKDSRTGEERWLSATGRPLIDRKKAKGGVLVLNDITSRKLLEKQVAEISDREQLRIGQDLHDGVCQRLVSTAFAASVLAKKLEQKQLSEAAAAEQIVDMINDSINDSRGLARGLYPVKLELDGLESALAALVDNAETFSEIACGFECEGPILIHDSVASTNLYRIGQEALNNAVKHSKATKIIVELEAVEDEITLSVRDDGIGFSASEKHGGMGLHIMNYRARLIGASLDIRRGATGGTIVICSFLNSSQLDKPYEHNHTLR